MHERKVINKVIHRGKYDIYIYYRLDCGVPIRVYRGMAAVLLRNRNHQCVVWGKA